MHGLKKLWMTAGDQYVPTLVMPVPGLDPGIFSGQHGPMRQGYRYMMTNRPHGVLYTGVTSDLSRRAYEHREGIIKGFTPRYGLIRLV
jgi:hypothetical protein